MDESGLERRRIKPINFVPSTAKTQSLSQPSKQKSTSSGGDVASLYKSIVSSPPSSKSSIGNAAAQKDSSAALDPDKTIYCEKCNMHIPQDDLQRHIRGTAHMVSSDFPTPTDFLTLNGSNIGFRMLQSQGWKYEEGLGASGQGRRHPIATSLKHDRLGLGHSNSPRKRVTHSWQETEQYYLKRQGKSATTKIQYMPSGKELARKARKESRQRVAMLRYLNEV